MPFAPPSSGNAPLDDRQRRLLDAFADHLGSRGVRGPRAADFAAFGSLSRLEALHKALTIAAPGWFCSNTTSVLVVLLK